jgi:hypothetical protein
MSSVSQSSKQSLPQEHDDMGTVAIMSRITTSWAKRVQARKEIDREMAISKIAEAIKTGPGTLGNIVRQRVKTACADLRDRWRRAAMDDIAREIERLKHEYTLVEKLGENPDPSDAAALEATLEEARSILARMRGKA